MASNAPQTPSDFPSEAETESRLTADRFDIIALIATADRRRENSDNRAASAYYNAAIRTAAARPPADPNVVAQVARADAATRWLADHFRCHLLDALTDRGFTRDHQQPRFRESLDMMFGVMQRPDEYRQFPQKPMAHYYPSMTHIEFADTRAFDWVQQLEAAFPKCNARLWRF